MKYIVWLILSIFFIFTTFAQNNSWIEQKLVSSELEIATAKKSIRTIGTNFTTCSSDLNAFSGYPWFLNFKKAFWAIKIQKTESPFDYSRFWIDICFSTNLQKIIVNVPYVINDLNGLHCNTWWSWRDKYPCIDTLNIYLYDITKNSFTQAIRDPKTITYTAPKSDTESVIGGNHVFLYIWQDDMNAYDAQRESTALKWFEREQDDYILLLSEDWDFDYMAYYVWKYDYVNNIISLREKKEWDSEYIVTDSTLPQTGPASIFLIFLVILSLFVGIKWKYHKL